MKDANQIAAEAARREKPVGRAVNPNAVSADPNWRERHLGTLTVRTSPNDEWATTRARYADVLVDFAVPGAVVITFLNGDRFLLYPEPGWLLKFEPNHREGE